MSSPTLPRSNTVVSEPSQLAAAIADRLRSGVRAVAFWIAALLPLAIFVLLVTGLAGQSPNTFVGLLALTAVCVVVGHGHEPGR